MAPKLPPSSISISNPIAYSAKPRWDGSNAAAQPQVTNNQGWDVTAPRFPDSRRQAAYDTANATINNNKHQWPMFVTDVSIDLALAGSMGQSRLTRDFYPRNFVQPSFVIQGQALDQEDYGNLCEFLHVSQQDTLNPSSQQNTSNLMQLWIKGEGIQGTRSGSQGVGVKSSKFDSLNQSRPNQILRGPHQDLVCQGYIGSMPRVHQTGVVSPTYTFQFIVAAMITGIYQEDMVQNAQVKTWADVLKSNSMLSVNKALIQENNKILKGIQSSQWTIFKGADTSGSSGSTGGTPTDTPPSGSGWHKVTATYYTGSGFSCPGYTPSSNSGYLFAELNGGVNAARGLTNPQLGPMFGYPNGLPCGFRLTVYNPANKKQAAFVRADIETGAQGASIDLYTTGAQGIGFSGSSAVYIKAGG